ncbi:MAG: branched-chain amino acid ABC transporter permease, partial [Desulfobacterales bacterium]|nr:branched-chain amino acid ABC transporter permease [Desulfobacterales bacterium]
MTLNRNRLLFLSLLVFGAGLVFLMRASMDEYILSIVNFIGIYVILAVSLNITNGFAGLFSLGHPGFMAIGGYVAAILTFPASRKAMFLELPPWLAGLELPFLPALLAGG